MSEYVHSTSYPLFFSTQKKVIEHFIKKRNSDRVQWCLETYDDQILDWLFDQHHCTTYNQGKDVIAFTISQLNLSEEEIINRRLP